LSNGSISWNNEPVDILRLAVKRDSIPLFCQGLYDFRVNFL
jgi:hypothetical protein